MVYRKYGETVYIRADRGDEIMESVLRVCSEEKISSAVFTGIGGCSGAEIQTFNPETGSFDTQTVSGMLELVSLTGNVVTDDNRLHHHTHAVFSAKTQEGHRLYAGHIKSITVLYTAEIELRPVVGGSIGRKKDPETGTGFWCFDMIGNQQ